MISVKHVDIECFSQIDLRIASITEVKEHPNADRLYVLMVDLGKEKRQIVAGIKSSYTPDELVGRKIILVANLKKANIRGVESQGMLLAGRSSENVVLVSPSEDIDIGVRLS